MSASPASWRNYLPLLAILGVVLAGSVALSPHMPWMHAFMGLFFILFALFKLLNIPGFVQGFAMYDLLTKRIRAYGYAYPFIELALGCAWLAGIHPALVAVATVVVMAVSAFSVFRALAAGMDTRCACLGTMINVPLSTVSVLEDAGMGLMALLQLWGMR